MKKYVFIEGCIISLIICLALVSCRKDFEDISTSQWNPALALPFIQDSFEMDELIGNDSSLYFNELTGLQISLDPNELVFSDTIHIESVEPGMDFREGYILAQGENGFPFDIVLQIHVPDSVSGQILETVEFTSIIPAETAEDGKVIAPMPYESIANISSTFFDSLDKANYITLNVLTNTTGQQSIQVVLYPDYTLTTAIAFQLIIEP